MIKIIIEMWPGGNEKRKYVMAEGIIFNDGRGTPTQGNYLGAVSKVAHFGKLPQDWLDRSCWKKAKLLNFPRKRLGIWDLLYRFLREIVGERNS